MCRNAKLPVFYCLEYQAFDCFTAASAVPLDCSLCRLLRHAVRLVVMQAAGLMVYIPVFAECFERKLSQLWAIIANEKLVCQCL